MASELEAPKIQFQTEMGLPAAIPPSCFYQPFPKPTDTTEARNILHYETRCPFSRATRVMLAVDLNIGELPFFKSYCRAIVNSVEEDKTYPFTQGENAPRIYRMTLDVVGRSLTDFRSSYHFISAIAGAMEAHDVAFFDCGVLHHDISVGSIVLTDDRGLLVDWDLCTKLDDVNIEKSPVARRPTRMGTWQFMSVKLLDPKKTTIRHSHHDDLESAFYVLLWTSLRYTKTEAAPKTRYTLQDTLGAFDELWDGSYGRKVGGSRKRLLLMPYKDEGIVFTERPELNSLMAELAAVLSVRYGNVPTAAAIADLENALVEMEALPATLVKATRKTVRDHEEICQHGPMADRCIVRSNKRGN